MKIIGTLHRTETLKFTPEILAQMWTGFRFLKSPLRCVAKQDKRTDAEMVDATLRAIIGNVK